MDSVAARSSTGFPRGVRVRTRHDGVQYVLPAVPFAPLRLIGLLPLALAAPFIKFGAGAVAGFLPQALAGHVGAIFGVAFGTAFLIAGGAPALLGLYLLFGTISIRLRPGRIDRAYRIGPVGRRRSFAIDEVAAVRVNTGEPDASRGRFLATLTEQATLSLVYEPDDEDESAASTLHEETVMAMLFPRDWLEAIARDLAPRIEQQQPSGALRDATMRVEIKEHEPLNRKRETEARRPSVAFPRDQPVGSRVTIQRDGDHTMIEIPPAGVLKGSAGLFVFSLVWCAFMCVFTGVSIGVPIMQGQFSVLVTPFLLGSLLFWSIGIGMLIGAINMGRRRAICDVVEGMLLINRANLFGVRQHEFAREDIEWIGVGPSGMKVNERPVMQLQIQPRAGKRIGLFTGRDEAELHWLAWELQAALGLENSVAMADTDLSAEDAAAA